MHRYITGSGSSQFRAAEPVARPAAELDLLVLHATHDKRGIDPRVRDLPELTKPPFASFATYALLENARLPLQRTEKATHRLPNGRILAAELVAVEPSGAVRLSASISEPGGSAFLPLLEVRAKVGQRFIVAGQGYRRGILVLVLTLAR